MPDGKKGLDARRSLFRKHSRRTRTGDDLCTILPALVDAPIVKPPSDVAVENTSWPPSSILWARDLPSPKKPETKYEENHALSFGTTKECFSSEKDSTNALVARLYPDDCNRFADCLQFPEKVRQCSNGSDSSAPSESGREWCVVLLRQTFGNGHGSAQVAENLASVLCVDSNIAKELLDRSWGDDECIMLHVYKTQREAMLTAQRLRDLGMAVRVMSISPQGTPRGMSLKRFAKQFAMGDEQHGILRLAGRAQKQYKCTGENAQPLALKEKARYESEIGGRRALTLDSISAAVDVAFSSESWQSSQPTVEGTRKNSKWKLLVHKHKSEILKMREQEQAHDLSEKCDTFVAKLSGNSVKNRHSTPCGRALKGSALKEACKLVRTFIFGDVTDGILTSRMQRDYALRMGLQEPIGSKSMVKALHTIWAKLDADRNGTITVEEFRVFAASHNPLPVTELEELEGLLGLRESKCFQLEDLMRLIWPAAKPKEIFIMMDWCAAHDMQTKRNWVTPPLVLPQSERDSLRSVFSLAAGSPDSKVSFICLVREGFMHEYQREEFQRLWDQNGDGLLDFEEFCEMMCPVGFRAHEDAKTGKLLDGRTVFLDETCNQWFLDKDQV